MTRRFIPLHVHSHFSLLEGVDSPAALVERAAACGYPALALTDTNNLYGAVPFVEAARQYGIRPILGACLRHAGQRCTVFIGEPSGYRSLCRILSEIHLGSASRGRQPPVEEQALISSRSHRGLTPPARPLAEMLVEYGAGLHVLIDDLHLLQEYSVLSTQYSGLGAGSSEWPQLWLELIRPGLSAAKERALLETGQRLGLKPVASVAAHFVTPDSYDTFRLITAVRQGTLLDRMPRQSTITPAHHLADFETVYQRFRDVPEALVNAERLADECRSDVLPRGVVLPPAQVPRAHNAPGYLRLLCERGLRRRGDSQPSYRDRMEEELHLIQQRDLAGYFLVVRGIAREARRRGYSMALRGSAGNSLVCFLLGITNVDPLRFDLPLERFLHPGRPDLPDIDLDFDWKVRDGIIQWVFDRYGHEHTAMISSHLYLQPASAFREASKVHGLSNEQITRLLESLSSRVGGLLSPNPAPGGPGLAPKGFPLEPARWPRLLADARRLLGRPHHLSIHPGGIVITPEPIADYVPLQRAPKGIVITQFEKDAIEHIGLVKIDLLGNRALATMDAARKGIRNQESGIGGSNTDPALSTQHSALGLLRRGDTLGVNQLESPAMRHLLIQMQPRGLMDVIQSLALIRPGAASIGCKELFVRRRRGLEPVTHLHPRLEPVLRETHGLMLYEDDALRVVQALTGVSPPEADRLRKQITKCQSEDEAVAISKTFLDACRRNGIPRAAASEIWVQLAKFNSYSFCKSHAVSYGLIAWQAVQLKANHPLEFWVAALNNNQGMYPRRVYVEAAKRMGIEFLLPCVNASEREFSIEWRAEWRAEGVSPPSQTQVSACIQTRGAYAPRSPGAAIRTGLALIRELDEAVYEAILEDRARRGPFADLADFRRRVFAGPEALAALIRVGAFDFTGQSRAQLMLEAELEQFRVSSLKFREKTSEAEELPFDNLTRNSKLETQNWSPTDYSQARRWKEEWDLLGFLVGPPLMTLFRPYLPQNLDDSRCLRQRIGQRIRLAGLVATSRHTPTKRGEDMQFITLEDEWGLVELTLFPGNCQPVAYLTMGPYIAHGVVEEQYGVVTVTAHRFENTAGRAQREGERVCPR